MICHQHASTPNISVELQYFGLHVSPKPSYTCSNGVAQRPAKRHRPICQASGRQLIPYCVGGRIYSIMRLMIVRHAQVVHLSTCIAPVSMTCSCICKYICLWFHVTDSMTMTFPPMQSQNNILADGADNPERFHDPQLTPLGQQQVC